MMHEKKPSESRLLDNFGQHEREAIVSAASERRFLANSVVTNQGHSADYMFLVRSGRARFFFVTEDGRKINLIWLVPGAIFGAAALLSEPAVYMVSAETVKDSVLLAWDRATLRDLSRQYPRLIDNALLIAWDYLGWYRDTHIALISHDAKQRLAYVLGTLARTLGQPVSGGIELDVTNEDLAGSANLTLFTVSRLLNEWQRKGSLVKKRGKVVILDIDELSATWRPGLPVNAQRMPSPSQI